MTTRTDLAFLRRRGGAQQSAPPQAHGDGPQASRSDAQITSAIADFVAGRSRRPDREAPGAAPTAGSSAPISSFLRSRSRRPAPAPEPVDSQPPRQVVGSGNPLDLDAPAPAPPATTTGGNPLDLDGSAPAATGASGNPLDLDEPAPAPPARTATGGNPLDLGTSAAPDADTGAQSGNPLDLDEPAAPPSPSAPAGGSPLDLSAPAAAPEPVATSPSGRHRRLVRHELRLPTIVAGERRRMDDGDSVAHLTRAQSAFGSLDVTPAVPEGSDLRLGVAYECEGVEGVVLTPMAPMGPDPQSPIFRVSGSGLVVNLRRVTAIDRFLIYAVLTGQHKQMPGGTVVVGTYGGSRLELPLGRQPTYGAQALFTAYVVEGRIVLRAEHDPFSGTLHQVCDAYGFTELTWRDPFTPLT